MSVSNLISGSGIAKPWSNVKVNSIDAENMNLSGQSIEYLSDDNYLISLDGTFFTSNSVIGSVCFQKVGSVCSCVASFSADTNAVSMTNDILSCSIPIPEAFRPNTNFGDETIGVISVSNQLVFFPPSPQGTPIFVNGVATGERVDDNTIICQFNYNQAAVSNTLHMGVNAMWNNQ